MKDLVAVFFALWQLGSISGVSISATDDVVAGRPYTLHCKLARRIGDTSYVIWYRDVDQTTSRIYVTRNCTPSIPVSPSSPARLSGGCQHVNGEEVYTVTIENVTEDMSRGRWSCQSAGQSVSVTLDVPVVSVSGMSISAPNNVTTGRPYTLKCKVTRPTGDTSYVIWYRDVGHTISRIYATRECTSSIPVSPSSPAGLSGGCQHVNGEEVYTVTIENVTKDMSRGRWSCQSVGQTASVTLDVHVQIVPVFSISAPGDVVVGRPYTLECKITRKTGDMSPLFWYRDVGQNSSRIYASRECTSSMSVSPSSPAGLSGGCQHVNGVEVYTVTIENVTEDTSRSRWICQYKRDVVATKLNVKVRSVRGLSITAPGNVVSGRSFTLECKITRLPGDRSVLIWQHDVGRTSSRIYFTSVCTSSIPVLPSSPAGISGGCQHVNGEEVYTVTIENVTEDMGLGKWGCQCGRDLDLVTLDVQANCI